MYSFSVCYTEQQFSKDFLFLVLNCFDKDYPTKA